MRKDLTIRPEEENDFEEIDKLVIRSFSEGTDYSDGLDVVALIKEIRASQYYIPELSLVAEISGKIVGHFMFSHFPLSTNAKIADYDRSIKKTETVMLGPVSVHADYFRQGVGSTMIKLGIEKVKKKDYKGIQVEGNPAFYNTLGFITSSKYNIYPTCGFPMHDPNCMMYQETYSGSLKEISGYIIYDMYKNA
ncbi:GNAT family N-acetyltransferase [Inconstantimicrobium mannanitabidum]|uniref:N-acetyltransferase n=1 Tax=Inconstantimicrobium mannanitabidum TaxID=1604901 RepID=A0ACB5RB49_9CLOT|nr:N-acetyltransferase [Clostridium sp. TW13]GKX66427.1 N-acetyltransferase [Clostridium sp. TW13]